METEEGEASQHTCQVASEPPPPPRAPPPLGVGYCLKAEGMKGQPVLLHQPSTFGFR